MFTISFLVMFYIGAVALGRLEKGSAKSRAYIYVAVIALLQTALVAYVMLTKEIPAF